MVDSGFPPDPGPPKLGLTWGIAGNKVGRGQVYFFTLLFFTFWSNDPDKEGKYLQLLFVTRCFHTVLLLLLLETLVIMS